MSNRIIRTSEDVDDFIRLLCELKLPLTVSWVQGADRTTQQNHLQWMWANEAAYQLGDRLAADIQAEWKLEIGVPILRSDDPVFRELYDATIRPLSHARKLELMKAGFGITSRMKVRQMVRFLDQVQRTCVEAGLILTEPPDDLERYHRRYREKEAA